MGLARCEQSHFSVARICALPGHFDEWLCKDWVATSNDEKSTLFYIPSNEGTGTRVHQLPIYFKAAADRDRLLVEFE
eukprot:gene971-10739_t